MSWTHREFREIRELLGLTQSELATELGMSLRQVQGLESGDTHVRKIHMLAMRSIIREARVNAETFGEVGELPRTWIERIFA